MISPAIFSRLMAVAGVGSPAQAGVGAPDIMMTPGFHEAMRRGGFRLPGPGPSSPPAELPPAELPPAELPPAELPPERVPAEAAGKPGMFGNRKGGGVRGVLARLGGFLDPSRLAVARAFLDGDYAAAGQMADRNRQFAAQQAQERAQAERRHNQFNTLTKPEDLGGLGLSAGLAELAMLDPQAFARALDARPAVTPPGPPGSTPSVATAADRSAQPTASAPPPFLATVPPGAIPLPDQDDAGPAGPPTHPYRAFERRGRDWLPYTLR